MHGVIVNQLRQFVVGAHGREAWTALLARSGAPLPDGPVPLGQIYPDEAVTAVVVAASEQTGTPVGELLEQFGEFIAPTLLRIYEPLVDPAWRTLDVLEHTEQTIHTVVRTRDAGALPPYLEAVRLSPTEVLLEYTSPRRLCAVAHGITRGVARHYREHVRIEDLECMHQGDRRCLIRVTADGSDA